MLRLLLLLLFLPIVNFGVGTGSLERRRWQRGKAAPGIRPGMKRKSKSMAQLAWGMDGWEPSSPRALLRGLFPLCFMALVRAVSAFHTLHGAASAPSEGSDPGESRKPPNFSTPALLPGALGVARPCWLVLPEEIKSTQTPQNQKGETGAQIAAAEPGIPPLGGTVLDPFSSHPWQIGAF